MSRLKGLLLAPAALLLASPVLAHPGHGPAGFGSGLLFGAAIGFGGALCLLVVED